MVVGEPFFLPSVSRPKAEDYERCTEMIMGRIAAMLPPQYRGHYQDGAPPTAETPAQQANVT